MLDCLVASLRVSDWECHPKGSASLSGGKAATISISSLWLETRFEKGFSLS
ncbi:hypothetical protein GXM_01775 [Nostoc sphaeroides CCNUC1]|uniref:Uncharacterized protein n=1 Tax=Nostoc sphaeroides CCNUC1 TaxID=2653204 RepID=A0A5P8VV47_9NOSO|nr:hypothetical protein GXM_01775 [Nostoc sphaeroides CCNUC1]